MKFTASTVCTVMDSPLGLITLAASDQALVGVWFDAQAHFPDLAKWRTDDRHPLLQKTALQLREYFAGSLREFDVPIDLAGGTLFQREVWQSLRTIAPGTTRTYGAIAASIQRTNAVRAVGGAIGRNPLSIIVPCHRVIGSSGSLTGYAGGLERKIALLRLEGALQ